MRKPVMDKSRPGKKTKPVNRLIVPAILAVFVITILSIAGLTPGS